ncbi:hypothetical protein EKJ_21520 [Qipengyuania flava]|uniref:DUF2834 domain-containing protein n=1 Tax=Qipengyuania flava TaxID=192812 RepID=A0A3T1CJW4_9SPHN|nr:hypothetical protein [Qipengyuania flava]BBI21305.1 hypothetical protein EKJ_21520 [Qipengyuania flava]
MNAFEFLAAGGAVAAIAVLAYILSGSPKVGSAALAAALSAGFGAFTAITIAQDGVVPVWTNHTQNFWGVQVWWDLLFAVGIAAFFIAPRARAAEMNLLPWLIFVAATASIGLLAMVARLFWLERRTTP